MPPCCWPSTSIGLRMRPQSSTATWRIGSTARVSMSTSTTDDVRAERERRARLHEVVLDREREPVVDRPGRELGPRERPRRDAGDAERPLVGDDDVVGRGLEQLAGHAARPLQRPRATRPSTALPPICSDRDPPVPPPRGTSAVSDCTKRDALDRDAEPIGDDHRERRGVTLPVRRRARLHRGAAVVVHLDLGVLAAPLPPAVISTYAHTPMPSCFTSPRRADARPARRAARRSPRRASASVSAAS